VVTKIFISLSLFFVLTAAQAQQAFQAPLVKDSMLLDAYQGEVTVVVGERGHILVGDNQSVSQAIVPTTVTLTAVDGLNETFVAVGHDASILRSSDSGNTWELVYSNVELDRPFLDVMFIDEQEVIAVGGYGLFYRSVDAGLTWTQEQYVSLLSPDDIDYLESIKDDEAFYQEELDFIFPHFNRLSMQGDNLYLAGEAGLVARSTDKGNSWERYEIDYYGSFFDTKELLSGELIAIGLRGNMFVLSESSDWVTLNTCATTSLNAIVAINDQFLVLGNNGVVFSLDPSSINSEQMKAADADGCRLHSSLTRIDTDISSAITGAVMLNNVLTAVSADGLQSIELPN
jgi:photosystem II stability/assembly factor-like uncharacterized protein